MVSIVIPSYNSTEYIIKSVESAINQNVEREIIIVDDNSSDDTIDKVKKFVNDNYETTDIPKKMPELGTAMQLSGKINPCNFYIAKNTKNHGVAYSRNKGVKLANGEYIAFLDSDDWWESGKLKKQLAIMEKTHSSLSTTDRELVISGDELSGKVVKSPEIITFKKLLRSNWINCSAVVAKKSVLLEFPMRRGMLHEDYLCWLHIVKKYGPAVNVTEPLLKYRVHIDSKSGNKFRSMKLSFATYEAFGYKPFAAFFLTLRNLANALLKFSKSLIK